LAGRETLTEDLMKVQTLRDSSALDDRSTAIIACAFLEDALEEAIAVRLPGLTVFLRKKMFSPSAGSAGNMSAKIDLAEALRAVGPNAATDLRTMATIRNKFAHTMRADTFDAEQVRGLAENLRRVEEVGAENPSMPSGDQMIRTSLMEWDDRSRRGRFVYTAVVLTTSLYNASIDAGFGLCGAD